jgi:hypothetical protein
MIRLSPMAVSRLYKIAHCNQSVCLARRLGVESLRLEAKNQ